MDFKTLSLVHSKVLLFIGNLQTYYTERIFISRNRAALIFEYNTIREMSTLLASVCSIFQQNFNKVYFWYHGVFQLRNTPPSDNYC